MLWFYWKGLKVHRSDSHGFKTGEGWGNSKSKIDQVHRLELYLIEGVWGCCVLWLFCALGPLAKGTSEVHSRRSLLTCQPLHPCKTPPPLVASIWSKPLQSRTLWGPHGKQLVVLFCPFSFLLVVSYLFLKAVFCCRWFIYVRIVVSDWSIIYSHGIIASHNSTWHPRLIASIVIHAHVIRACFFTVVTLSSKEPCMNITM